MRYVQMVYASVSQQNENTIYTVLQHIIYIPYNSSYDSGAIDSVWIDYILLTWWVTHQVLYFFYAMQLDSFSDAIHTHDCTWGFNKLLKRDTFRAIMQ